MNIITNDTLSFKGVQIESLPKGFKVSGSLDLTGSSIKELPEGLKVGLDLILDGQINNLPKGLMVGRNLDISCSGVSSIPKDAVIGGKVIGLPDNYIIPQYIPNIIYNHIVCCGDGTVVPFVNFKSVNRAAPEENYDRGLLTFYLGLQPNLNAISYCGKVFMACKSFEDGEQKIERLRTEQRCGDKYKNLDINELRDPNDLLSIYRDITDACEPLSKKFAEENFDLTKKYSIKQIIDFVTIKDYKYHYLFIEYFAKEKPKVIKKTFTKINNDEKRA